ncbi:hypothetical protein [Teichococcus deserti]|uniref:hypothetical protein n=1 Tax=Teichococcus deserti TaxID=1817963 RepID=UPI001054B133|nr:hypothetical protein [Pseudoroseomonas deserti]
MALYYFGLGFLGIRWASSLLSERIAARAAAEPIKEILSEIKKSIRDILLSQNLILLTTIFIGLFRPNLGLILYWACYFGIFVFGIYKLSKIWLIIELCWRYGSIEAGIAAEVRNRIYMDSPAKFLALAVIVDIEKICNDVSKIIWKSCKRAIYALISVSVLNWIIVRFIIFPIFDFEAYLADL